ncbi:L,D-transpeptidase [Labilibaculum manganireducens]|uniref:L,D-transpeptidase n=1 Tax=Labilibaculum manganireducens TaxID=1940525 RepID=UPI0029F50B46|nr:L,D-transpeptidase [Labilibaculum manganireducens]
MINDESNLQGELNNTYSGKKSKLIKFIFWLLMPVIFWFIILFILVGVPYLENRPFIFEKTISAIQENENNSKFGKELEAGIAQAQKKMDRLTPGGAYLIVNTSDNTFSLYRNKALIRDGLCSTGSYIKLEAEDNKNWIFQTPKGVFSIQGKITSPVWRKPDWAFVEEGLPIPGSNSSSRFEYGVLGDYALSLGKGYLIHGTLYKRFLGQPVTHGCIRMNDDDLKTVYQSLPIGAKVFIY